MTPGWETAAGFFVGSVRGPDALEKWQPRRTRSRPTPVFLLFLIVIFYRCLREAIEVDRARTRPQVAGVKLKGCGYRRS
jgi:hypothetical protein